MRVVRRIDMAGLLSDADPVIYFLARSVLSGIVSAATETHLDLRGLKCPLPALKTRKALRGLAPGALLVVTCTDPMARIDIPHLLAETKDSLVSESSEADALVFRIRKAGAEP